MRHSLPRRPTGFYERYPACPDYRPIPALAQVGKSGFMFILNRETGEPIHGIEERPMAKADVPGEWYPASQPIPIKPGPVARVSMTANDLVTAKTRTLSMPRRVRKCGIA